MNELLISLIVGISSSIVATVIFILSSELFRKVFVPWYSDKVYRGVRIDGEWELTKLSEKNLESSDLLIVLLLVQKGDAIKGVYKHEAQGVVDEYILEGRLRDMYFLATAVPKSNRLSDALSLLLHISNEDNALIMKGSLLHTVTPGGVDIFSDLVFRWK